MQLARPFRRIGKRRRDGAPALTDVLNGIVMDATIDMYSIGERILAFRHHQKICGLDMQKGMIVVYDRGYISNEMVADLIKKGIYFVFRLKSKQYARFDLLSCGDHDGAMAYNGETFNVRVVKFRLENGVVETLAANIPRDMATIAEMKELSSLRWGIEVTCGKVKIKLQLENFTGVDKILVGQDFCICMLKCNLCAFGAVESNKIIENLESIDRKLDHKANINVLILIFCNVIPKCILDPSNEINVKMLGEAIILSSRNKIPKHNGRHFKHETKHHPRFVQTIKSAV
jgi:hypothetical protein